jgi:hypothetical protein
MRALWGTAASVRATWGRMVIANAPDRADSRELEALRLWFAQTAREARLARLYARRFIAECSRHNGRSWTPIVERGVDRRLAGWDGKPFARGHGKR